MCPDVYLVLPWQKYRTPCSDLMVVFCLPGRPSYSPLSERNRPYNQPGHRDGHVTRPGQLQFMVILTT